MPKDVSNTMKYVSAIYEHLHAFHTVELSHGYTLRNLMKYNSSEQHIFLSLTFVVVLFVVEFALD